MQELTLKIKREARGMEDLFASFIIERKENKNVTHSWLLIKSPWKNQLS